MLGLRHRRLAGASGERHRLNLGLQEDDKIHDNCLLSAAAHRDILELSACNCNTHEIRLLREVASNLPAGRATIEFLFFGKAVRASGFDGPYVVRDLHGYWHENAQGPGVPIIEPLEFVTQRYRADEFSDQEWDSEEKRQRIALYEQTVALAASAH